MIGFRTTLAMGAGFAAAAFVPARDRARREAWEFVVAGALLGAGISFAFASMANLIVAAVPQSQVGIATGINTVTRTVGGAFGAAVATAILAGHTLAGTPGPDRGRLRGRVPDVGGRRAARHRRGTAGADPRRRGRRRRAAEASA